MRGMLMSVIVTVFAPRCVGVRLLVRQEVVIK